MNDLREALLTNTQQKVLGLLFSDTDRSFYTNEIIRLTGMGVATIKRELDRMTEAGILTMTRIGNQHHYQANPDCLIFDELRSLVEKILLVDSGNISDRLRVSHSMLAELAQRFHIHRMSVFGSAARGELSTDSDIDLLIEFEDDDKPSLGSMVRLQDELSRLFEGRKVDVATPSVLNNPYRKRAIKKDLELLYAA